MRVGGRLYQLNSLLNAVFMQGSVLLPVLFLLVMDPQLRELEHSSLGPSVYKTPMPAPLLMPMTYVQ